jgi:hypothetical protein
MSYRQDEQGQDDQVQDDQIVQEGADGQVEGQEPAEEAQEEERRPSPHLGIMGWVISAGVHGTLILLMGTIYFLVQDPEPETPPVRINQIPPPPEKKEEKPKMERELLEPKVELDIDAPPSDNPQPISQLDLPVEDSQRDTEVDSPVPRGREEAVADSEMGGTGAFMAIGPGGGGAGMFGSRSGGGRKRALGKGGGSKASESAVDAALRWFKKHQSVDGSWEADKYWKNCTEDPKCEPGAISHDSAQDIVAAMTGYALLCYLGQGHDHKTRGKYQQVVKKGVDFLIAIQKPDGAFAARNYAHPIATMAIAEAYAMTNDPDLRGPAQKGIDIILKRQNRDPKAADAAYSGLGWDYVNPTNRNDSSTTGWNAMALKSGYAGGLNVGTGIDGVKKWLDKAWRATNKDKKLDSLDPYKDQTYFPYSWDSATDKAEGGSLACVGMVCGVFTGRKAGDPLMESLANFVMANQVPKGYPTNTYYMYYNTLGIFQIGGEKWKTWNGSVRDMLIQAQRKGEGCLDGSWDWVGTGFPGHDIGRVLSTAYNCLCLEVYYRYAQVNKLGAAAPGGKGH